jgi:hypothetical protein
MLTFFLLSSPTCAHFDRHWRNIRELASKISINTLSSPQQREIRKLFLLYDKENNGYFRVDRLRATFQDLGFTADETQAFFLKHTVQFAARTQAQAEGQEGVFVLDDFYRVYRQLWSGHEREGWAALLL